MPRLGSAVAISLVSTFVLGGTALAVGFITITPASGPPGTEFEVRVACEGPPSAFENERYGWHGTLPMVSFSEEEPGSWVYRRTAGDYDIVYDVGCDGEGGVARFDSEHPRLFLGPIPDEMHGGDRPTRVDGTDCPAGTRAAVDIQVGDGPDATVSHAEVDIDEYGDWNEPLPVPVGSQPMVISASCGSVIYADLVVPTLPPLPPVTATTPETPGSPETLPVPTANAATAQPGSPSFTG